MRHMNMAAMMIAAFCVTLAATGIDLAAEVGGAKSDAEKDAVVLIEGVPREVSAYLACSDSLYRATLVSRNRQLETELSSREVLAALRKWLKTTAAWNKRSRFLTAGVLGHLYGHSKAEADVSIARAFIMHENATVRYQAYGWLVRFCFQNAEQPAARTVLLQQMFMDTSPSIQKLAIEYVKKARVAGKLRYVFEAWHRRASPEVKKGEVYGKVSALLQREKEQD